MKYCSSCKQQSMPTMVMCANCGCRDFTDVPGQQDGADINNRSATNVSVSNHTLRNSSGPDYGKVVPSTWLELPCTPWRRYAARILDIMAFGGLAVILLAVIFYSVAPYSADQFFSLLDEPLGIVLDFVITAVLGCTVSGLVTGVTGSSFGKIIFGIMVTDQNGQKLGVQRALQREMSVCVRGLGLGIPIISLFTLVSAFRQLQTTQTTPWDQQMSARFWHRPSNVAQYGLNLLGVILILAFNVLYKAV